MAKPQHPLLSFRARGTIADTLTFQKRGRATIARKKPIPKDPKSPAQLAQRQTYKEAVAAWHSLTPEEKDAWRGVCPGLTAYQCFMSYKIRELLAPPPPPEEYTEEQTQYDSSGTLQAGQYYKQGQRLTIPNREVTKLGFWLSRNLLPTGDVIFKIERVIGETLIASKLLCDASELATEATYYEVTLDTPVIINEEVRIYTEFDGGEASNYVELWFQNADVKGDELKTALMTTWVDIGTQEMAYRYKYYLP